VAGLAVTDIRGLRTVVTAAGDSRGLFLPAGFACPKSLVNWEGLEVLAHAIGSYAVDPAAATVAVNAAEDDEWAVGAMVTHHFPQTRVVRVTNGVRGALATATIALGEPDDAPLLVAAGDSRITGGIARFVREFAGQGLDAGTIGFESDDPRWSYLSVNDAGAVRQVAEKQVIGPYATTGVFYFASARTFADAATWAFVNNASHQGLFYVSATLNYLISTGQRVGFATIDRADYQSWSLPVDFAHPSR